MEKTGQDIGRTSCRLNWSHHPKSEDQNKKDKNSDGSGSNYRPRFRPGSSINISLNVLC